ncbi:hypothetical protein HWI79_2236 [Cryptosporidium felis]|nr:hypothetical protein HWI79_2236 [Cryptosporidium felis]
MKNTYSSFFFHRKRFGRKKGTIEQIAKKLPFKKNSIIIPNDWSQDDYLTVSFIIFLSKRLYLAHKTFDIQKYKNWAHGEVPPLEELSGGIQNYDPLPNWKNWWQLQGNSSKLLHQIRQIHNSILNTPDTFRLSDESISNKITRPFFSLSFIFSKEKISDNAFINNTTRDKYKKKLIKELETKKNVIKEVFDLNEGSSREKSVNDLNLPEVTTEPLSLFKKAYNHVRFVRKRRKFNSENGDTDIELLPNWWEKEFDLVTAIILTVFKFQYKHRMCLIKAEERVNSDKFSWKKFKNSVKHAILCTSGKSSDSIENIPIWHRFGEKWQSFPQGAMVRILNNVSKLSVITSDWDIYDYVICLCFYYLIKREKLKMNWFALGPLSGSPKARIWRRFKKFIYRLFSPNKGIFEVKNEFYDHFVESE